MKAIELSENQRAAESVQERLTGVPDKPGVYLFKDAKGKILYAGKAKALRTRLRSYFQKSSALDARKTALVRSIADFEFTVTENELEALVLEANLIKQHRPRYNILLRDDKSYPYLRLTLHETWPRLEVVRRIHKDGARYFGPYVPAGAMWETLSFIRNTYHIPSCRYSLEKRMRPCIQYQIKRCVGPCSGDVDHAAYMAMIREVELLLEGRNKRLLDVLEKRMAQLSREMKYEEAAVVRDRIRAILSISESQKVVAPGLGDVDVIGIFREGDTVVFKILFIRNGVMIGSRHFVQEGAAGETRAFLLRNFLEQFYVKELVPPPALACSALPEDAEVLAQWLSEKRGLPVSVVMPRRGVKRKLVQMAEENAEILYRGRQSKSAGEILRELASRIGLEQPPRSIGAFDISNITATAPVGAFIYWEDGTLRKEYYRHVRMDAVRGPDDYGMMREMVGRTIASVGDNLPDMVIIDGGREHLETALDVFRERGIRDRKVIGVAKDPDRVFLEGRKTPIMIGDGSASSLLLRKLRDEAHRFAIQYHRKLRAQRTFASALDKIYGLGQKRRFALLSSFGSIEAVKNASAEEIARVKGFSIKLAEEVLHSLNKQGSA